MLIYCKHISQPHEGKRKEGYMVLDRKQNHFTGRIFVPQLLDMMFHP